VTLESGRWQLFADQEVVEAIPVWERPVPRFEDFFSDDEFQRLGLEEAVPALAWSHEMTFIDGPVRTGAEAAAWVELGVSDRITLNPYEMLQRSLDQWRRVVLHELSHIATPSFGKDDPPTGHDFAFAAVFASCQVKIGLAPLLRPYDLSDVPAADRAVMRVRAETLGQRFGASDIDIFEIARQISRIETVAEQRGWDKAMRPPRRFWLF